MIHVLKLKQIHPVCAEVEALYAVVSPILKGLLYSVKRDIAQEIGGYEKITIALLSRLYQIDGCNCNISFKHYYCITNKHETKNLIVCPIPYDQSFMEIFYQGWAIIKYFLNADTHVPKEVYLPHGADRLVAKFLEDRRNFPVIDVIDALNIVKQPELLDVVDDSVELDEYQKNEIRLTQLIAPESKLYNR